MTAATRIVLAGLLIAGIAAPGVAREADVIGQWMTRDDESRIEIFQCGDEICGRIAWIAEPDNPDGTPKRDFRNPDEELRARPLLGLQLMNNFARTGPAKWSGGTIYSPRSGKTNEVTLKLKSRDRLKVGKSVFTVVVGQTWRRAVEAEPVEAEETEDARP